MLTEPAPDQPVLADPTTAALVALNDRPWSRLRPFVTAGVLVALAVAVDQWWGSDPLVLLFVLGAGLNVIAGSHLLRLHRLNRAAAGMLATTPWIPVEAQILRGASGITDLRVQREDGVLALRVFLLTAPHRVVLRRTGKVWIAGPNFDGVAAVRVEGSHMAWPARLLPDLPEQRPTSRGDQVEPTAAMAAALRKRVNAHLVSVPVVLVVAYLIATSQGVFEPLVFASSAIAGLVVAGAAVYRTRHRLPDRALPGLVAAGGWVAASATVDPWTPRPDGSVEARVTLRLPDGPAAVVLLRSASIDLLGTIGETGGVWVTGSVVPGGVVAVGFPEYPLVAAGSVLSL
ncbi:hypothetical protein JOD54_002848 [Actinokineospora baliensis]|uniref:hypothetical protein n=1 Tax=Actinokineospora baliensis TaxID=547056 RepID=UPI00195AEE69|nr:hypothetical protein [Actinokineospora baliensis]MBM7772644.1 hypothetical protein [Actinokineospora baliensis]